MTFIDVYLLGIEVIAALAVVLGVIGWRNGMPFVSAERNGSRPNDGIELIGTMLCYALVWPYLFLLGGYALWRRLFLPRA
jgi:hypothetical protein